MSDNPQSSPNKRPRYEDRLPVSWSKPHDKPGTVELEQMQHSNEEVLRVIYSLDESGAEQEAQHDALAQQVQRIDAKLNFVMDMVGQLLLLSTDMPDACPLALRSDGIEWRAGVAPEAGTYIYVNLYLKIRYPKPLVLPAIVTSVTQEDGLFHIICEFENHGQNVEDWLEKLVFRHHRRAIARSRH